DHCTSPTRSSRVRQQDCGRLLPGRALLPFAWASEVALAIDDALNFEALSRAQEDLQSEHQRLKLLLDLTNTVVSSLELRDVLRTVSASVRRVMNCHAVGVMLPDADKKQLQLFALDYPESKGFIKEELLIPIDRTLPGKAFAMGVPSVVG